MGRHAGEIRAKDDILNRFLNDISDKRALYDLDDTMIDCRYGWLGVKWEMIICFCHGFGHWVGVMLDYLGSVFPWRKIEVRRYYGRFHARNDICSFGFLL